MRGVEKKITPKIATKTICLLAVLTATLTAAKTALAFFVPGIEIVTLLLITYTLIFGWRRTMVVCLLFIAIEILIWGPFIWWIILYLIYWPALVTVVAVLPRKWGRGRIVAAIVTGIVFTALFGVLSTFIEVIFLMDGLRSGMFWRLYALRYLAGVIPMPPSFIPVFVIHVVNNAIVLPLLVPLLYKTLKRLGMGNNDTKKETEIKTIDEQSHI